MKFQEVLYRRFSAGTTVHFHKTSKLPISATGIAIIPTLKNSHAVISTFSRRSAISHKIVASDPVTERFGPRSTPIKIACVTTLLPCECRIAAPLINPTGKLFIPFESNATADAATPFAIQLAQAEMRCTPSIPIRSSPPFCNASTITKSPATSGSTDHDTPFAIFSGSLRSLHATTAIASTAAQQVGAPSENPSAEDATSAAAAIANPASANFPSVESKTRSSSACIFPRRSFREIHRKHKYVSTIAATDGTRKIRNHIPSGGNCSPNPTRFAGLEIGKTKLAAFAISAHASKYGFGATFTRRTTASTAGVSTTAVASLERNAVTTVPTR